MSLSSLQHRVFLFLLAAVTVAFGAILWPFFGAVFWAVVLAILFAPLQRRLLQRLPGRANLAALLTLGGSLLLVVLPTTLIAVSLVQEAGLLYARVRSGDFSVGTYFQQVVAALPAWAVGLLDRLHLASLGEVQQKLSEVAAQLGQLVAGRLLDIGQNTLSFFVSFGLMLYLLFFLLRDGVPLAARIRQALPLDEAHKRDLLGRFTTVIRATVKGNLAVALAQGLLGGFIFWALDIQGPVLWGVLMAYLSLLPAVGAGLIWGPVAVYLLATGAVGPAVVLTVFGVGVIGMVDNLLRPLLVGKDTGLPDYLVLLSTLGGMALFGLNGFVIGPVVAALFVAAWDLFVPGASVSPAPSAQGPARRLRVRRRVPARPLPRRLRRGRTGP